MVEACNFNPIFDEFKINKLLKVLEITDLQIPNVYGIAFKNIPTLKPTMVEACNFNPIFDEFKNSSATVYCK